MTHVTQGARRAEVECSVVVPTHRGAHRLPPLLEALSEQDYDGTWELIVVVDGDLDETVHVLDVYRDRLPIVVILHTEPLGVVASMNDGIAAAQGRIVMRCDDDLTPQSDLLRLHMDHHNSADAVGVIGATRDVFGDTCYARAYGLQATERSLAAAQVRPESYAWVGWAANNSVPRRVLIDVGGFDERFVYGQDSELGYRLALHGVRIISDPGLTSLHRAPSVNVESRASRAFVSGASRRLFDEVHPEAHPAPKAGTGNGPRLWGWLVYCVSFSFRERGAYARVGFEIDRILPLVPLKLAQRLISLIVEAAGRAGRTYGKSNLALYKSQKVGDLSLELATTKAPRSLVSG